MREVRVEERGSLQYCDLFVGEPLGFSPLNSFQGHRKIVLD